MWVCSLLSSTTVMKINKGNHFVFARVAFPKRRPSWRFHCQCCCQKSWPESPARACVFVSLTRRLQPSGLFGAAAARNYGQWAPDFLAGQSQNSTTNDGNERPDKHDALTSLIVACAAIDSSFVLSQRRRRHRPAGSCTSEFKKRQPR